MERQTAKLFAELGSETDPRALTAELVLEGLHQHLKLAREDLDSQVSYKEMVKLQLLKSRRSRGRGDGIVN